MADTQTQNYGWTKPEVGASPETWGNKLNANFDSIDSTVKGISDTVAAIRRYTPGEVVMLAHGTLTGANILKANGSAVSRTTYAELFARIGTNYGAGNGTSTFNLPDYRGVFLRGWDDGRGLDPSRSLYAQQADSIRSHTHAASAASNGAHSHTASAASNGAHSHTGTAASAGAHTHTASTNTTGAHTHNIVMRNSSSGGAVSPRTGDGSQFNYTVPSAGAHAHTVTIVSGGAHTHDISTNSTGAHTHAITIDSGGAHTHAITVEAFGGNETRPINMAVLVCIAY